jgi:phage baseplate assembly protein W
VDAVPEDLLPDPGQARQSESAEAMTSSSTLATTTAVTQPDLYGKGISFPPRVGPDGGIVWSSGELNVRECLCTILRTAPGERMQRPTFGAGLDRMLFEPNGISTLRLIQEEVAQSIARWEPRVSLGDVTVSVNAVDPRDVDVTITYTLIATGVRERLQMTVSSGTGR